MTHFYILRILYQYSDGIVLKEKIMWAYAKYFNLT